MEKDLGVHIHKSLKVKEQVNYVVKKANVFHIFNRVMYFHAVVYFSQNQDNLCILVSASAK